MCGALVDAFTPPNPSDSVGSSSNAQEKGFWGTNELFKSNKTSASDIGHLEAALAQESRTTSEHMDSIETNDNGHVDDDIIFPVWKQSIQTGEIDWEHVGTASSNDADEQDLLFTTPFQLLRVIDLRLARMTNGDECRFCSDPVEKLLELRKTTLDYLETETSDRGLEKG